MLPLVLIDVALLVSVVLWAQNDARARRLGIVQDFGLFAYVLWFALISWYVIKTRGTRAWRTALGLVGATLAPIALLVMGMVWHAVFVAKFR